MLRLNHGYGPNYPEYGSWYDENGKMAYHGKFRVMRSSLGWPKVVEPEVFGSIPGRARLKQIIFSWEDARRLMQLLPTN